MFSGYSYNERSMLSLGMVDCDVEIGSELVLVWGEEDGGSAKPVVERHQQVEIRAVVSPVPYSRGAADLLRRGLADGRGQLTRQAVLRALSVQETADEVVSRWSSANE